MKKLFTSIIVLIIATSSVYAQNGTYKTGSLLWKISGKDLSKPSYLFGTLHFKSGDFLATVPGATAALESSEQVVGEMNMANMSEMQMHLQQAMMMPPNITYQRLYSDEDYQFVNEQLASFFGIGLEHLGILNPAGIQVAMLPVAYSVHLPEGTIEEGLDIFIQSHATQNQKPVLELETVDSQIRVLFGASLQRQADLLLCALKNIDQEMAMVPELINHYVQGNLNDLYRYLRSDVCPATPAEINAMNKDRNEAWMKKLPDMMKHKSSFIAVGALHLAGADGLLNLLEKAGYTVEAVVR
ncbi:MAG: TraB/GumN family protein [Bacteroidales bacterium]|nr:TraB/GumN family protein [Bacteroidales bacterium]